MDYRYCATSVNGFIQQLSSNYLPHGYWFYVSGVVPEGKSVENIDRKLLTKYGINISRQSRARRKQAGLSNLHYLRFERFFLLLATHGKHCFFDEEGEAIRDVRRVPIKFQGYSVSVKRGQYLAKLDPDEPALPDGKYRVRVQIGRETYRDLKAYLLDLATHRSAETLGREFYNAPFEPYAPVRQQMLNLLRLVNKKRKEAGYELLSPTVLRYQRRIVRPFEAEEVVAAA
jgi:hypothetical protein